MNRDKMRKQIRVLRNKRIKTVPPKVRRPRPTVKKGVVRVEPFTTKKSTTTKVRTSTTTKQTLQQNRAPDRGAKVRNRGCHGCRR